MLLLLLLLLLMLLMLLLLLPRTIYTLVCIVDLCKHCHCWNEVSGVLELVMCGDGFHQNAVYVHKQNNII